MEKVKPKVYKYLIGAILVVGIFFRVGEYLPNKSLWIDEIIVLDKITHNSVFELSQITRHEDSEALAYPVGFLAIVKLLLTLCGKGEYALRFYPFLCSILSLFVFYKLTKEIFSTHWQIFSLALFSINRNLIYFAAEAKPYASDVLVVLILCLTFFKIFSKKLTLLRALIFGLLGVVSFLFAIPSLFILFSLGIVLLIHYVKNKHWEEGINLIVMGSIWILGFALYYYFSLRYFTSNDKLLRFWEPAFFPWREDVFYIMKWLISAFEGYFVTMMQIPKGLALSLLSIGVIFSLSREKHRGLLLIVPIITLLFFSALKIYPFGERTGLFLLPFFILILGKGLEGLFLLFGDGSEELFLLNKLQKHQREIAVLLSILLLYIPFNVSLIQYREKAGSEEIKAVLQYVQENRQEGDLILVYSGAAHAFRYYAGRYQLEEGIIFLPALDVEGEKQLFKNKGFLKHLSANRRAWIVFTHVKMWRINGKTKSERELIVEAFDSRATRLADYIVLIDPKGMVNIQLDGSVSAATYLYDLRKFKNLDQVLKNG